jgi:hypothetical protein
MRHAVICIFALLYGCAVHPERKPDVSEVNSVQAAIDQAMAEAHQAIDKYGETESAMSAIEIALVKLAGVPGLKEHADLSALHGGSSMSAKPLASEGDDGITLFLIRFAANSSTPVHDHLTWGVLHVLEGQDRYIEWERMDDGTVPDTAELSVKRELTLNPGESVYWLPPPKDIHTQESLDSVVWELVIAGKNLMASPVTHHRHYFDPESNRVEKARP